MYSRDYSGKTVNFEASGGLVNSSLVMQDQQTDTYWSIMEGEAVAGELEGERLVELPVGEKMQWRRWKQKHPDTLVLSVDGKEDAPDSYAQYWRDPSGFRGQTAADGRLPTKEPIFAFRRGETAYATPQGNVANGKVFELESGEYVFLYRKKGTSMFQSTDAYISKHGFEKQSGEWVETSTGASFDTASGEFADVEALPGFDTFWYNFSLNNPGAELLP